MPLETAQARQERLRTPEARKHAHALAVTVQDACNATGLMKSMGHEWFEALCADDQEFCLGTDKKNQHPLLYLMTDKLADLCGMNHISGINPQYYGLALEYCETVGAGNVEIGSDEHKALLEKYYKDRAAAFKDYYR